MVLETRTDGGGVPTGVGPLWDYHGCLLFGRYQASQNGVEVLYRRYEERIGVFGLGTIRLDQCRLRGFRPRICVGAVFSIHARDLPEGNWGSYAKLWVIETRVHQSHVTLITSLIAVVSCKPDHETSVWITPSAVTCTCRMVGLHVGSTTTLVSAVSPACRRLRRFGVCQSYSGARFFFCRRSRATMLRARLSKSPQVSSLDLQSNQRTLAL
mgnify:CR=1 FL=1